jgi:hypothetical protein
MQNKISAILERVSPRASLRVLTLPTHEGYQSLLDKTGHQFLMLTGPQIKQWDHHTRKLPPNHVLLPCDGNGNCMIPNRFDLVLCQNRMYYEMMNRIAGDFGVPILTLDHTEPPPGMKPSQGRKWISSRAPTAVYITEHNRTSCGGTPTDIVIPHGIDTTLFAGWTGTEAYGLSVVNHYKAREQFCGYSVWEYMAKDGIPLKVVGDNPGWTESINDPTKLTGEMAKARFYLNTSLYSPVPLSMLEAMAVGCPVVTTAKQEIPNIIVNGVNGFMHNEPQVLLDYCKELLQNPSLAAKIGQAGRQTIIDRFGIDAFVENWNNVLKKTVENYR